MSEQEREAVPSTHREREPDSAVCPACRTAALPGQRFCGQCGAPLARICSACGRQNPTDHRFCGACAAPLTSAAPPTAAPAPAPAISLPREERRWATVLFADLSGFTAMAERMDPEDVKALVHRCAERLADHVRRYGGTVIQVQGDGMLAAFGAPVAHEDDAERAVRAALAMRDSDLSEEPTRPIRLHIGLNTGEMMAGLVGPPERRDYNLAGDTVNTAHRIAAAAAAGSVWVGEETYQATRHVVRYQALPPVAAKGKERPVGVWEALGVAAVPSARPLGTAPLVGRDAELALLADIWAQVVRKRRPHLVTVLGEAGIGKSRLAAEFERRHLAEARVLHGRCLPYGEVLGYSTLAMALKEAAGITADDDAGVARARLIDVVAAAMGPEGNGDAREVARHLALLSGLDVAADRAAAAVDQRSVQNSVRRFLEALGRLQPLCLMLEDIHWADNALLDLIEFVAARAQEVPLLILTQARPPLLETRPAWGRGLLASTSLPLEPLAELAGRELIEALCRERGLAQQVAAQVGRGSGGNPLFAEELVAMIAERSESGTDERGPGIPSVIKALISARMDALPPAERSTLQLAAVLGKRFWEGGLRALSASAALIESLAALEQKGLLRAQPGSQFRGDREYAFKHDLIREVAYDTLPRAERRALHGRVADWIEQAAGERLESFYDLLAHHTVQADQQERALGYLLQAAERARRTAAHREEAALLARATGIAEQIGQEERVAELRAQRGTAFSRLGLWSEAKEEMEAALAGLAPEQVERRAQVLAELADACLWGLDAPGMALYAAETLELAQQVSRDDLTAVALACIAEGKKIDGDLVAARDHYRRAMARAGGLRVASLTNVPLTLYMLGEYDEAVQVGREAVQQIRELNNTSATMNALSHLGLALAGSGRYGEAMRVFAEARQFGVEYEVGHFVPRAIAMSAGLHLDVFDFAGNEALAEEARDLARSVSWWPAAVSAGIDLLLNLARRMEVSRAEALVDEVAEMAAKVAGWHGWQWQMKLAEARAEIALARGHWDEALRPAAEAITQSRASGRVKYQVAGLRSRAEALARLGRQHEAIADLRNALVLARPVGDPAMFLHTAAVLLALDGDDTLAGEARAAAHRILAALPDAEMLRRFVAAEPVRRLGVLGGVPPRIS